MTDKEQRDIFARNLQSLLREKGLTQLDIVARFDVSKSTASGWFTGNKLPRMWRVDELANWLGVPRSRLLDDPQREQESSDPSSIMRPIIHKGVRIPVLGSIPAGIPIEAIEDVIGWEEIPYELTHSGAEYFALKVQGESMYPVVLDGDVVIIRKSDTCRSGQICLVYVNGTDATLKRVTLDEEKKTLTIKPENPNFAPRSYTAEEIESLPVRIGGYVVEIRRRVA